MAGEGDVWVHLCLLVVRVWWVVYRREEMLLGA